MFLITALFIVTAIVFAKLGAISVWLTVLKTVLMFLLLGITVYVAAKLFQRIFRR